MVEEGFLLNISTAVYLPDVGPKVSVGRLLCLPQDMILLKFVSERDLGCLPAFQPAYLATPGPTALALELMIMSTCCFLSFASSIVCTYACSDGMLSGGVRVLDF